MRNKEYEKDIYDELRNEIAKLNGLLNEYLPEIEDYRQRRKMELAIIQAKIELKTQENNSSKMLLASTARMASRNAVKRSSQKAKQIANEFIVTLDSVTRAEMQKGKYIASYTWNASYLIEEENIDPEDFAKAIQSLLENYGYRADIELIKRKGVIVELTIIWNWSGKHE